MKNIIKILFAGLLLFSISTNAQMTVNGAPPPWGPSGYSKATYYYIPDVESYYDIKQRQYIYKSNGTWTRSRQLPATYRNYDLFKGHKVVITDPNPQPYKYFTTHKKKYYKGYKGAPQKTIGTQKLKVRGKSAAAPGHNKHLKYKKEKHHDKK